jgi:hypothetical protein
MPVLRQHIFFNGNILEIVFMPDYEKHAVAVPDV